MAILNAKVWNKAYMLEFLGMKGGKSKCFTFSVPPESEELQFSQRVSETKTFGGSVFDCYGNDTIKINLSGSTVNEERKLIYRGKALPSYYTGEKEIFELQKLISDWNKLEVQSNQTEKAKIYLYDLSKMSVVQLATGTASRNYWRVFIKDLKIKRDKGRPNTYNYTLEMIGVIDEVKGKKGIGLLSNLSDLANKISSSMELVNTVYGYTEGAIALTESIASKCVEVKNAFDSLENASHSRITSTVTGGLDTSLRLVTGNTNNAFYNSAKDVLALVAQFYGETSILYKTKTSKSEDTAKLHVYFVSNGGTNVKFKIVLYSEKVIKPATPTRNGYSFIGWYTDSELQNAYDFDSVVTDSFTLYAKWFGGV